MRYFRLAIIIIFVVFFFVIEETSGNIFKQLNIPHQVFPSYDDSKCFQFSWLVSPTLPKLEQISNSAIALELSHNTKKNNGKYLFSRKYKDSDSLLAFSPSKLGHSGITSEAVKSINIKVIGESKALKFSRQALYEISKANKEMDVKFDFFPSPEFYVPCVHFDNEQFHDASTRLIDLKERIISLITISPINGEKARYFLGAALHTLQDFYAHTNWIELGFTDIDTRLGAKVIPNPRQDMQTSEKLSKTESLKIYKNYVEDEGAIGYAFYLKKVYPPQTYNYKKQYDNDKKFHKIVQEIALAFSDKPGKLLPDFIGTKNINYLTSGYFIGLGTVEPCTAPPGKTRHGVGFFGCPDGLNKDTPKRPGYKEARKLAVLASQDYINQILKNTRVSQNIEAIKTLMDIE